MLIMLGTKVVMICWRHMDYLRKIFGLKCTSRGDIQQVTNFSVYAFQKTYMVSNTKTIQNEGLTASHYWW